MAGEHHDFSYERFVVPDTGSNGPAAFESYQALERLCRAPADWALGAGERLGQKAHEPRRAVFTGRDGLQVGTEQVTWGADPSGLMTELGVSSLMGRDLPAFVIFPLSVDDQPIGCLLLGRCREAYFDPDRIMFCAGLADTLSMALVHRSTRVALRERLKELTCLLQISQIAANPDASLEEILQQIVDLIPTAWQYPECTTGRIRLDGRCLTTAEFREGEHRLSAEISVRNQPRCTVDVFYTRWNSTLDEGPFLKEERHLIDAIARKVALMLERKQTEADQEQLRVQLMHADRLATIGQLAAGVAHEINEPLGHILGFGQLALTKEVCMVGSSRTTKVDVHILAATNKDLLSLVRKELFREDLYYRLNVITVELPPLRERGDDVLVLAHHFVRRFAKEEGRPMPIFSDRAIGLLRNYEWPGNVRELENTMQRLVIMTDSNVIEPPDLPAPMRSSVGREVGLRRTLAEVERAHIRNVLASVGQNKTQAARILGIDRKTLRQKVRPTDEEDADG